MPKTVWELLVEENDPLDPRPPLLVEVPPVVNRVLDQVRRESKISTSPVYCEHANECPHRCPCPLDCYCYVHGNCGSRSQG